MNLLLDTATFWWAASEPGKLSAKARAAMEESGNEIYLSPISIWELLVKHQLGKLPTDAPITDLIAKARAERTIRQLPLIDSSVLKLPSLPSIHRDPFDRLLICQALDHGLTLLTPDQVIKTYPVPTLW